MKPGRLLLAAAILLISIESRAEDCSADCQLVRVREYFVHLDAVLRKGSTVADIDALFRLFDESVRYEHLEYDASFDRESWRNAFIRNLENGSYKGEKDRIRVLRSIHGGSHLAVEYAYGSEDAAGDWIQEGDGLLVLFGFNGDRIVLVREYWK